VRVCGSGTSPSSSQSDKTNPRGLRRAVVSGLRGGPLQAAHARRLHLPLPSPSVPRSWGRATPVGDGIRIGL